MPPRKRNKPMPAIRPGANAPKTARAAEACDSKAPLAGPEMPDVQTPMTVQESSSEAPQPLLQNLGPALQLLPYQRRWVEDNSHLKIVAKARQIGYSFAASIRALLECLKRGPPGFSFPRASGSRVC